MDTIKKEDYVLYHGSVGKVELVLGNIVIANIDGVKVKDIISKFKKWDKDKIHNISKEKFIIAVDKILDDQYFANKYPHLSKSDIEVILTSGAVVIQNLKDELFK